MLYLKALRRFSCGLAMLGALAVSADAQQRDNSTDQSAPTPQRVFELPNLLLEIPKRLELERTDKGRVLTQTSDSKIDWPAAFSQLSRDLRSLRANANIPTTAAPSELSGRTMDERGFRQFVSNVKGAGRMLRTVDRPRLPILLPPDPEMLEIYKGMVPNAPEARAITGKIALFQGLDEHYAATFDLGGASMLINGSRLTFKNAVKSTLRDRARRLSDGTRMNPIERDDVGVSVAFNRFGAAYTVEIVCDNPETDSRCSQDNFINDIYRKLLLFGGKP